MKNQALQRLQLLSLQLQLRLQKNQLVKTVAKKNQLLQQQLLRAHLLKQQLQQLQVQMVQHHQLQLLEDLQQIQQLETNQDFQILVNVTA